jgi:hypothetical protein
MTRLPEDVEEPQPDATAATAHTAATVPAGLYFDPVSGLNLPRGTQLASVGRRIGAFFLAIPLSIVTLFIGYAIWGLIVWGRGQTPAHAALGDVGTMQSLVTQFVVHEPSASSRPCRP